MKMGQIGQRVGQWLVVEELVANRVFGRKLRNLLPFETKSFAKVVNYTLRFKFLSFRPNFLLKMLGNNLQQLRA